MTTKKAKTVRQSASSYLATLMRGPLTLGGALSALRESDEMSLSEFANLLGISRSHLCDIEQVPNVNYKHPRTTITSPQLPLV